MPEFESSIVDISEDALDQLFDETPEKTVNADILIRGQKNTKLEDNFEDVEEDTEEEEETQKPAKKKAVPKPKLRQEEQIIEDYDVDEVFNDEEETEEEVDENEEEEEEKPKKTKKAAQVEEETPKEKEGVFSVLKNTVDYLVESGVWDDFDNREEMDINEETYAKLVIEQDKRRVQGMFEEMVDNTGPFGKAIIDFVKNGGNPDEIIDLFKEQKQMEAISIDSLEGQKEMIKQYYTEVLGWKSERTEKYVSNLVLSNELESEAQEVKDLFTNYYQKEAHRLNQDREDFAAKQQEAEAAFETNIRTAIKSRRDLSPTEKKLVEDQLLRYDQKLPNGKMVNKFYVNFARMQANPEDYIELVMFVNDKQKFVQKVATKEKTEAAANAFKFIKGNGAVSSKKGSSYEQIRKNDKVTGFDWGLPSK